MHAEPALADTALADTGLADTQKLQLPQDLLSALNGRARQPENDYGIESLKPSLWGRLIEKLLRPGK